MKKLIKKNHAIKKLSKYIAAFDYIDKILIVLSATTGGVLIISFTTIVGAPVGIASASFTLSFCLNFKQIIEYNKKKKEKKKYDKILMLAKSKLYSIHTLIYHALIDMDISHEEFITILKEKDLK